MPEMGAHVNATEKTISHLALAWGLSVAIVGASPKRERPVFGVMAFLLEEGYSLYPVNPAYRGEAILGLPCLGSVREIPLEKVDVVAFFLAPDRQDSVLKDVESAKFPLLWWQPGAENPEKEAFFRKKGKAVFSGYCLMEERKKAKRVDLFGAKA